MREPMKVIARRENGDEKTVEYEPGTYIYKILSKPGHRAFTDSKSGIRYERVL